VSTLLPVQAAAPARATATPAPDRRSDASRAAFASSLASARSDAATTRSTARDDDAAAVRARHSAHQQSQEQLLLLSGAMRFAAPRIDEDMAVTPDTATSTTLWDDIIIESLPEFAPPDGSDGGPQSLPDVPAPDATVAVYQLLPGLPMPMQPIARPDQDAATQSMPSDTASTKSEALRRALAVQAESLLEDHVDAPAAQLSDAAETAVPTQGSTRSHGERAASAHADALITPALTTDDVAPARRSRGTTAVQSDLSALDPAFREKLEKVMERLRTEFGHTVTVVETARSQSRQEQLYAQGRSAPGPVVTWTKNSRHTKGMAADLMVDGAWDNPDGYAHLAALARDEGLRTLGARDPGHVEMPGDGSVSGRTLESLLNDLQGGDGDDARTVRGALQRDGDARDARLAQVASVAQVARVSQVATVASVAAVARPGAAARESSAPGGESSSPLAVSTAAPLLTGSDVGNAIRTAAPVGNVNMADRISQLMDLQATQSARPLNSVLLRVQNESGMEDQLRIDARGTTVGARLGIGNVQQAAALTESVGELRAALERRGLTTEGLRVQPASRPTDSATFARAAAPVLELAATRAAADAQMQGGSRDQAGRDQQQREAFAREQARTPQRPSSDDPRHRSRREQPETRQ